MPGVIPNPEESAVVTASHQGPMRIGGGLLERLAGGAVRDEMKDPAKP